MRLSHGPSLVERLAATTALALERLGLGALARSAPFRAVGRRLLLSGGAARIRVIGAGIGRGLRLTVPAGSPQSYWLGTHEWPAQAIIANHVGRGTVVYDCGANIGYYSAIFARLVGPTGRVYAFEPSPEALACLSTVASLNGFSHLAVVPRAVWSTTTTLQLTGGTNQTSLAGAHISGVFGTGSPPKDVLDVAAISVDDFVYKHGNPPPAFLKVDVEGSESEVLDGARRVIAQHRPVILVEVHGPPGAGVWAILSSLGYRVKDVATGRTPANVEEFAVWIRQYIAETPDIGAG